MKKYILLSLLLGVSLFTASCAKEPRGEKQEPPKEALEICKGKTSGEQCTINTPHGKLVGQCLNTPDKKYFACMPTREPKKD